MKTSNVNRGRGRPRKRPVEGAATTPPVLVFNIETGSRFISLKVKYEKTLGIELTKAQFLRTLMNKWEA